MKTKAILLGLFAMATLAACNNDENISTGNDGRQTAAFTASIDGQQVIRAHNTTWDNGDAIGITGKSGDTQYANVAYATEKGDGNFSVVPPASAICYQDNEDVLFTAYYPYIADGKLTNGTKITADTKVQANQPAFDFLYATGTGSKRAYNVPFLFTHQMAKVVLTIKKGSEVSFDEVQAAVLTLQGFKNNGSFDISSGEAMATGEALASPWTFAYNSSESENAPSTINNEAETIAYALILFPQEFSAKLPFTATIDQTLNALLDFTQANTNAGDSEPGNYLKAGRQYNLSVTLNKTSLTVNSCEITQWTDANGGNFDAN